MARGGAPIEDLEALTFAAPEPALPAGPHGRSRRGVVAVLAAVVVLSGWVVASAGHRRAIRPPPDPGVPAIPVPRGLAGRRLAAETDRGLAVVDLGTGAIRTRVLPRQPDSALVARADGVVWMAGGHGWALPWSLAGPVRDLGATATVLPGQDPATVWLSRARRAIEVDLRGKVRRRVALPAAMLAELPGGFLVSVRTSELGRWSPGRAPPQPFGPGPALFVAAAGDRVVVRSCPRCADVVLNATTGQPAPVDRRSFVRDLRPGWLAPDGSRLVLPGRDADGNATVVIRELTGPAASRDLDPGWWRPGTTVDFVPGGWVLFARDGHVRLWPGGDELDLTPVPGLRTETVIGG